MEILYSFYYYKNAIKKEQCLVVTCKNIRYPHEMYNKISNIIPNLLDPLGNGTFRPFLDLHAGDNLNFSLLTHK